MNLVSRISDLITAIRTETKSIRTLITGSPSGTNAGLNTDATNVVAAINEIKVTADNAITNSVTINDTTPSASTVYSGNKVESVVTGAVAAALEGEDLSDLAAQVAANAAADASLVSFGSVQSLSAAQKTQAGNNLGVGNPDTDFVAMWNAA